MAYTETRLVPGSLLTSSAATYYTVVGTAAIVKEILLCNTSTTTAATFTVYIVPLSGSAGSANMVLNAVSIAPGETKIISNIAQVMPTGYFISAFANVDAAVSFSVSGVVRT